MCFINKLLQNGTTLYCMDRLIDLFDFPSPITPLARSEWEFLQNLTILLTVIQNEYHTKAEIVR